jgi:hypothetical protein
MPTITLPFSREMVIAAIAGRKVAPKPYCFSLPERSLQNHPDADLRGV